jgi:hypothetical protein
MSAPVVGIDLDNTIATYDGLFHRLALAHGFIDAVVPARKRLVRDAVRQREGDVCWQRLQASAYGALMAGASLAPGAAGFQARCRDAAVPVFVISHRTEFAPLDPGRVPLRAAALDWMRAQRLFGPDGLGLREGDVLFGATRAEKLACIARAGCTHFVDDLEEVLLEPGFPEGVVRILYAPDAAPAAACDGIRVAADWDDVHEVVFGSGG